MEALQRSHTREAYQIRRMLTEGAVRASDKRAQFVGIEAYEEAGGIILRDLFEADDGGWLQDPGPLDRLVAEKLEREAEAVRAEGWKWIEVAPDFPYGHTYGLRRLSGTEVPPSAEEVAARDALKTEFESLEEQYGDAEEFPEGVDQRLGQIETALEAFDQRPVLYDAAEVARAGAFVSIDRAGVLRIERGYVRPEHEPPVAAEDEQAGIGAEAHGAAEPGTTPASGDNPVAPTRSGLEESDEDEGVRPLSDRLLTELTAHRTLALREAVANDPDVAFLAALHALCLKLFYPYPLDCCVDIEPKRLVFGAQAPGLADTASAKAIEARHAHWAAQLPKEPGELWDMLRALDSDSRQRLFAHCVSLTVNAVYEAYSRRPRALAHAGRLAEALALDMAAVGWNPTVESYLGRVTKRLSDTLGTSTQLRAQRNLSGRRLSAWLSHMTVSEQETPRPLLTPGEILQLPASDALVMVSGRPPTRAGKLRYYADHNFLARRLAAPALVPDRYHDAPPARSDDWSGIRSTVHHKLHKAWSELVTAEEDPPRTRERVRERTRAKEDPDRHSDLPLFAEQAPEPEREIAVDDGPPLGEDNVIDILRARF